MLPEGRVVQVVVMSFSAALERLRGREQGTGFGDYFAKKRADLRLAVRHGSVAIPVVMATLIGNVAWDPCGRPTDSGPFRGTDN